MSSDEETSKPSLVIVVESSNQTQSTLSCANCLLRTTTLTGSQPGAGPSTVPFGGLLIVSTNTSLTR